MATMIEEQNPPVTLEERAVTASVSSNLRLDENRHGAVNLLIAAGVAARGENNPSRKLGRDLQQLITEWDRIERPNRMAVPSLKQAIEELPLIPVPGQRNRSGDQLMTRDKEGGRKRRQEAQKASDAAYHAELVRLAQSLSGRFAVRDTLYALAVGWGSPDPDMLVAESILHWLDSKCVKCQGTGSIQSGELVRTCDKCHGSLKASVPGMGDGYRMLNYMDSCRTAWRGAFSAAYREIHKK